MMIETWQWASILDSKERLLLIYSDTISHSTLRKLTKIHELNSTLGGNN